MQHVKLIYLHAMGFAVLQEITEWTISSEISIPNLNVLICKTLGTVKFQIGLELEWSKSNLPWY